VECATEVGSGLICKFLTMLERVARDKRSSLFSLVVCDIEKGPAVNNALIATVSYRV